MSGNYKLQLHSCTVSAIETRGYMYKLVPDRCNYELRRRYFSRGIVPIWNSLPNSVVSAESVNCFKLRLISVYV